MSLYYRLKHAGCELDSHESDLYVKASEESTKILKDSGVSYTSFRSQIDNTLWYDVPFHYEPFWERRLARHGGTACLSP